MRRRLLAATVALTAGLGLSTVAEQPAFAGKGECPSGYLCTWPNGNYTGGASEWLWTAYRGECINLLGSENDSVSSWFADFTNSAQSKYENVGIAFYKEADCYGVKTARSTPSSIQNLAGSGNNDTYSSFVIPWP